MISTLKQSTRVNDRESCMAFTVSFIPNTGNKYYLAACDDVIRLYDFEHATVSNQQQFKVIKK